MKLLACIGCALLSGYLIAQNTSGATEDDGCGQLMRRALVQYAKDPSKIDTLRPNAIPEGESTCAGLALANLGMLAAVNHHMAEAEAFGERSIGILAMNHASSDPILLRSLKLLLVTSFEQGKLTQARRIYARMLQIRAQRPGDRLLIHTAAAMLFQYEGKLEDAESELLLTLRSLDETERIDGADKSELLRRLGVIYMRQHRFADARPVLERALRIVNTAGDSASMDRIVLLKTLAAWDAKSHDWLAAAEKLGQALAMLRSDPRADPVVLRSILTNYATALRKTHRRREARSMGKEAAAIEGYTPAHALVDVTDLRRQTSAAKH